MTSALIDAIGAAAARAQECRERLEQLRVGGPYRESDAVRARERLEAARIRAEVARHRGASHPGARPFPPPASDGPGELWALTTQAALDIQVAPRSSLDTSSFPARMQHLECSVSDVWISYAAVGGRRTLFEVDAALHGALVLPHLESLQLDQALWEREHFL